MNAIADEARPWSRLRWTATISIVVAIQLVLALALSSRPILKPDRRLNTQVILPETVAEELQTLTDPTLLALGGSRSFSAIWLSPPNLPPVLTDWEQAPQWLGLKAKALGGMFLQFAHSNSGSLHGLGFKTDPQTLPTESRTAPKPLRTESTLRAVGALAHRSVVSHPELPSWPAKDLLLPSRVRVVVDHRGFVTSSILQSGSGSIKADRFAVNEALQMRFAPVAHSSGAEPQALGQLVYDWHAIPQTSTNQAAGPE